MQNFLFKLANLSYMRAFVFSAAIAGLYYTSSFYDDGKGIETQIATTSRNIEEQKKKGKESDEALRELENYRNTMTSMNEQFKVAAQQLPSEISASDMLKDVDTISKSTGVRVRSKEPKGLERKDILELLPLKISAIGSYSELTMFLYYLSSMERITRVNSFVFATIADKNAKPGSLTFEGDVISYRYVGKTEAPVAGKRK